MNSIRRFGKEAESARLGGLALPRATNVAVIGLGYWGPNLVRVLFELPDVTVRYVCDLEPERLAKIVRRYPSVEPTRDVDRILSDPEVDAVLIATPVFTHFDLASRALRAGKHTFVEKPLAASSDEAGQLLELAEENDVTIMCGHTFLYSPPVRAVKRLIDEDELGDIHFISSSRVNLGLHQPDVSVVWDLGPHDFSIMLYWMGRLPDWMGAVGRASVLKGLPDVAFIDMSFGTTLAHAEMSWLAPSKLRRTVVVGSKKMVVYDDTSNEPLRVFDSGVTVDDPESFGEFQLSYRTGDIVTPKLSAAEPLAVELSDFIEGVRTGAAPDGNAQIARDVVRLIEAAEASLEENGAPIGIGSPVEA